MVRHPGFSGISAQVGARDMNNEIGINQLKRRDFLRAGLVFGAGAAGVAAGYAALPHAFARAVLPAKQNVSANANLVVMTHLAGRHNILRPLSPLSRPAPDA